MKKDEAVIIFKQREVGDDPHLIPINCVIGHYEENDDVFIDEKGFSYFHFSRLMPGRSFGCRCNLNELMKRLKVKELNEAKKIYLNYFKNGYFFIGIHEQELCLLHSDNKNFINAEEFFDKDVCGYIVEKKEMIKPKEETPKLEANSNQNTDRAFKIDTKSLKEAIKRNVVAQDKAIDKIVTILWQNSYRDIAENILISGSTGVGKTEIFRSMANKLDIPIIICDITLYTSAGYVGKNVEDMLTSLLREANGDIEKAKHGIIVIDEFDKIAGTGKNDEVATTKVQDALLKMIEGNNYTIKYNSKEYNINTSSITFVGAGSFERANKYNIRPIGFGKKDEDIGDPLNDEQLIDYGLGPELLGRFPNRVRLSNLEILDFCEIMTISKLSAFLKEINFLRNLGLDVKYTDELILNIAKKAYLYKCGARGINRVVNDIFVDILSEISDGDCNYRSLEIKPDIVSDSKRYVLKR